MRKNQAAQSIALAFGLVGGLGFLGYTMLGDMLVSDPGRGEQVAPAPTSNKLSKAVSPPVKFAQTVSAAPAAAVQLQESVRAMEAPAQPAAPSSPTVTASPRPTPAAPLFVHPQPGPAPVVYPGNVPFQAGTAQAPAATIATPAYAQAARLPQQVVLAAPPAPMQPPPAPIAEEADASAGSATSKRGKRRRWRNERVQVAHPAPTTPKTAPARPFEPSLPIKAPPVQAAPAHVQAQAPAAAQVQATQAPVERKAAVAAQPGSAFTSKDDMSVIVSGQKAWVQVSPTRTMEAKKGDVLPNLGKILEIRGNQVVAEKGTLTTN